MQPWLRKLANFWLQKVNPQIVSLIATIGTIGLLLCLLIIYLLAQLSEEVLEREHWSQVKEFSNLSRGNKNRVKLPKEEELSD